MKPVCTYCGEPILPTDKTATGPNGIVHSRCRTRKLAMRTADFDVCPQCHSHNVSRLLACCLNCNWTDLEE